MITVVTKYDGKTGTMYVSVLKGRLTPAERRELRDRFECDLDQGSDEFDEDVSNMFFREFDGDYPTFLEATKPSPGAASLTLLNVDDES